MSTDRKSLAASLRAEAELIRQDAEARMEKLYEAATVLEAEAGAAPAKPEEVPQEERAKSVVQLIREAALTFGKAVVLTQRGLRDRAIERNPDDADRIKVGLYNAINRLKEKEELKLVSGGFERTDAMVIGEGTQEPPKENAA